MRTDRPLPRPERYRGCLVCGGERHELWTEADGFRVVFCPDCGFVWVNPHFSPEQITELYQGYIEERLEDNSFVERNRQYLIDRDFIQQFIRQGTMLDVGCSGGFFLNTFAPAFEKYGVELDEVSVAHARKTCSFGANIRQGSMGTADFPDAFFDLVVIRGVIQYIDDLDTAIDNVVRMLKPGGYLYVCATPNIDAFAARLFRDKWSLLNPLEHLFQFSPETLKRFLGSRGFELVASDFPYLQTPYCDSDNDHRRVLEAMRLVDAGERHKLGKSPAFWGNMMNLVFCMPQRQGPSA